MDARREAVIWIGGEAGEGIASAGDIFMKTAARCGLGAFAHNSYQSVIRGGEVVLQIRVGAHPVLSQGGKWDFLLALNQNVLNHYLPAARPSAAALFNADSVKPPETSAAASLHGIPVGELTRDLSNSPVMQNTILLAALMRLLGIPWDIFVGSIRNQFGKRKPQLADLNVAVARRGWDHAEKKLSLPGPIALEGDGKRRMVITGNQAIGLGAVAGGCKFYSAYPMTPASSIMHWLAPRAARYGMLMKQAEDELAAINMAVGAGYAGVRAMVGTSGGGFALMTEAIGLAGMIEAPVVAVLSQRAGPSTGLATKTEQGDLFQALGASQGEYPKAVLAALDPVDAYYAVIEAHNLAEKYQMPVIVMSDLYLSERNVVVDPENFNARVPIERGETVREAAEGEYLRYRDTVSGVSPRALPGTPGGMHIAASDEHNEMGVLISDWYTNPTMRTRMVEKRMRKMNGVRRDTAEGAFLCEGPEDADLTIVGWGSTYHVLEEARRALTDSGHSAQLIQFRTLWPFPAAGALPILQAAKRCVCVENNQSGQLARLVRQETGFSIPFAVRKYDGEPFSAGPLVQALEICLRPKAPAVQTLISAELDLPVTYE
ncbi:MAG: 2-oxoacid:acceptor oxidoreductase subunit alpha [Anaerolineales bacterium]|nr:2-oxoacid:acceptor oxidoreductase subunit alpha [Anaerolineales bacterium]